MKDLVNNEVADAVGSAAAQLVPVRESLDDLEAKVKQLDADIAALEQEIAAGAVVEPRLTERRKELTKLRTKAVNKIKLFSDFVVRLEGMRG